MGLQQAEHQMRGVFRTSASLLGIALGCAVAQGAAAQSADIPLNYTLNTSRNFGGSIPGPVVILTINVGVNGGTALPYAFDTGSAVFLTPNGVFNTANRVASAVDIDTYGSTHTFWRRFVSDTGFVAAILCRAGSDVWWGFAECVGRLQRRLV
jgi:hypothetical protein